MVQGLGNDIIEIARIRASIERGGQAFLDRLFTPDEQAYCLKYNDSAPRFAGRFAAKEAIVKAMGTGIHGGLSWLDIEVLNNDLGRPLFYPSANFRSIHGEPNILVSISHCHNYAAAVAVWS